jgi:hypothetical protein
MNIKEIRGSGKHLLWASSQQDKKYGVLDVT